MLCAASVCVGCAAWSYSGTSRFRTGSSHRSGTWRDNATPAAFERYVRHVCGPLAPYVDWWATLNEANTYSSHGWLQGDWPPGHRHDWPGGVRVYEYMARGHRRAYSAIKEIVGPGARVGLTHVLPWIHPAEKGGRLLRASAGVLALARRRPLPVKVRGSLDWLGVQYYYDSPVRTFRLADEDGCPPRTDMGWRITPEGLYHVVREAYARYRVPIIVTENGLADAADSQRARFILDHLAWLHQAMEEGADVRGYLHWSMLDNFEWAAGFGPAVRARRGRLRHPPAHATALGIAVRRHRARESYRGRFRRRTDLRRRHP